MEDGGKICVWGQYVIRHSHLKGVWEEEEKMGEML